MSLGVKRYRPLTAPSPGGMREAVVRSTGHCGQAGDTNRDIDELSPKDPSNPSTASQCAEYYCLQGTNEETQAQALFSVRV